MVNIRLEPELWHEAKVEAVRQGVTLQQWVEEALKAKMKEAQK